MALAPWNVLAGGKFRTDAEEEQRRVTGEDGRKLINPSWERTEIERKVSGLLEKVAKEVGTKSITAGKYASRNSTTSTDPSLCSGHSLCHAQSTLRFPHHWRAQG